jgi:hypothetical protein
MLYNTLHTLKDYCERYYDAETGLPKTEMANFAVPKETLKIYWRNLLEELQSCASYIDDHEWLTQDAIDFVEKSINLGIFNPLTLEQLKFQQNMFLKSKK